MIELALTVASILFLGWVLVIALAFTVKPTRKVNTATKSVARRNE